jgi:hypothetical protein
LIILCRLERWLNCKTYKPIDVNDLNFHAFDDGIKLKYNEERYKIKPFKIASIMLMLLLKGFGSIPYFFVRRYDSSARPCDVAMFAFSEANNRRCLSPLLPHIPNSVLFTNENLMLKRVWFYAMIYSPIVIFRCLTYPGKKKKYYCRFITSFCRAYGTYIEAKSLLKVLRPKMVVVANDHSYSSRSFFRAAQHLKIKTAYVQHASVNKYFPPLEFDYAFLDGLESYDKYIDGKSCSSKVYLSGNPRFDIISEFDSKDSIANNRRIGIAVNPLDSVGMLEEFVKLIKNRWPEIEISIRPHPSSNMLLWAKTCDELGCDLSDSSNENPFEFIYRHQVFISGNSSFHLDVFMARKQSFFYNFSEQAVFDAYNFLKNKLMKDISNDPLPWVEAALDPLISKLINPNAKYFVGNFGTKYWGKSADLIGMTISDLLVEKIGLKYWDTLPGLNVFEIANERYACNMKLIEN